jgi:hypothetical protein
MYISKSQSVHHRGHSISFLIWQFLPGKRRSGRSFWCACVPRGQCNGCFFFFRWYVRGGRWARAGGLTAVRVDPVVLDQRRAHRPLGSRGTLKFRRCTSTRRRRSAPPMTSAALPAPVALWADAHTTDPMALLATVADTARTAAAHSSGDPALDAPPQPYIFPQPVLSSLRNGLLPPLAGAASLSIPVAPPVAARARPRSTVRATPHVRACLKLALTNTRGYGSHRRRCLSGARHWRQRAR